MENNNFYTYQLIDPRTNKPFYIGKGTGDRMNQHMIEARGCRDKWTNKIKCQIINSIENLGRKVIVEKIQDNVSEDEAYDMEIALILQYGKIIDGSGILSNIADGGQGGNGIGKPVQSYTTTGALIQSFKTLKEAARIVGVHKSTICAALNGRTTMAGGYRWGYNGEPPNMAQNKNFTSVDQYDILGVFVKSFSSVTEAAAEVKTTYTSIIDCCRGAPYHTTSPGFRWAYSGELPVPLPINFKHQSRNRKLHSFNTNNELVNVYGSIKEAVAHTDANATGISDCCYGRKKTSGGLCWKWVG